MVKVESIRRLGDFRLEITFSDGSVGEVDFSEELWGPVFEPLRDTNEFAKAYVSRFGVLSWPNGADWDSHDLYLRATQTHILNA